MTSSEMPSINVLHVTFDMRIGGTEMVIKNIVEGNVSERIKMSIFCIEEPIGPWGIDMQAKGVAVHSVNRQEGFDISLVKAIRQHITEHDIHVLHCHQYTPWVYATLASIAKKVNVIFTEHGRFYPDSSSWKRRFINPILASLTNNITSISQATKQALVDYEFLKADKISVIYNGIEKLNSDSSQANKIKRELGISERDIVFGTIARLDPIKNHRLMLKAFAEINTKQPNTKLIIVGDGELMPELKELQTSLALQNSLIFTGYIPYPKDYLAVFDIFLLSSLSEGTSMTLLEAMSLGKPCIVTDAGGNKEIVAHQVNGLVTPNDDCQAFSQAMLNLALDKTLLDNYGQAGAKRFDDLFSVANMSHQYKKCYGA